MPKYKVVGVKIDFSKDDCIMSSQPRTAIKDILIKKPIQVRIENTESGRTWDMIIGGEIPETTFVRTLNVRSKEVEGE